MRNIDYAEIKLKRILKENKTFYKIFIFEDTNKRIYI